MQRVGPHSSWAHLRSPVFAVALLTLVVVTVRMASVGDDEAHYRTYAVAGQHARANLLFESLGSVAERGAETLGVPPRYVAGPHKGASIVLQLACLAIECVRKSIHLSRT